MMENPTKMDDLGGKPTIFGNIRIYLKVKIDGDSRYQKVGDRRGTENKPICRDG